MPQAIGPLSGNRFVMSLACAAIFGALCSQAQAGMSCTFSPSNPTLDFGVVDVLNSNYAPVTASMTMTCKNNGLATGQRGKICLYMGAGTGAIGSGAADTYTPRSLKSLSGQFAGFQIYKDASRAVIWGNNPVRYTNNAIPVPMPAGIGQTGVPINVVLYGRMSDFSTTVNGTTSLQTIAPGVYTSTFSGNNARYITSLRTVIEGYADDNCSPAGLFGAETGNFPFTVNARVNANCKITASTADIDFGTQPATATNLQGSTSVAVQCTRTTPYFIGVKPGNNNLNGAGVMIKGTDQVPYQLRQAAGMGAAIWGNTATSAAAGNGVGGTGTGSVINHPIFATVPSADAVVGSYSDTVTVTVNY